MNTEHLRDLAYTRGGRDHLDERDVAAVLELDEIGRQVTLAIRRRHYQRRLRMLNGAYAVATLIGAVAFVGAVLLA